MAITTGNAPIPGSHPVFWDFNSITDLVEPTELIEPEIEKVEGRNLPIAYPQLGGSRDMSTGCKLKGKWKECMWGRQSPYDMGCTYHRFGIMCDKIVDQDGKEYN